MRQTQDVSVIRRLGMPTLFPTAAFCLVYALTAVAPPLVRFVEFGTRRDISSLDLPGQGPQGVALTHDRGTLFLSLSSAGQVAVIDLATRRVVRRIDAGATPDGIGWSPVVLR
jgi:DNA-binding beta-propeller fold protein YncE